MRERQLLLILVAFHVRMEEVERLSYCLDRLEPSVGYVVVVNDYCLGDPVDLLASKADLFLPVLRNLGYGAAINHGWKQYRKAAIENSIAIPQWLGALNTDLVWSPGTFAAMLSWLKNHPDVVLGVPQIRNQHGEVQLLCKRNPSLLALASRRFVPERLKPQWMRMYDSRYVMAEANYNQPIESPYLSGCCMVVSVAAFEQVGGFDEQFFLYLEDADLSRRLARVGRTMHLPCAHVTHAWGRGSHRSIFLSLVNLHSALIYFRKWGLKAW